MTLKFSQFLGMVNEDVSQELERLQADIAAIDAQIAQRTQPLVNRKAQLQKMLAVKQKQADATAQRQPQGQQGQQPQSNAASSPGSSGAGTPGSTKV